MRKSFKHILLAGLTIASTAMAMNAQTLTQDWKVTEGLPTAGNARWGIGFDGKVYTNDKSVPQIIAINAEGQTTVATSAAGTAITVDGAGNFIVNDGFPNAASSTTFKILPAGTTEMIDLAVTLPEGVKAGRLDFLGRAVGNVMSETGGAFYITPAKSGKIAKIFVAKGVQVAEKSKAIAAGIACAADGRIFLSGQNSNGIALWQVDPTDLNAAFKPVIKGTANPETYEITNEAGEFIAAPNVSMDLAGFGSGLKILMLSTNASGTSFSYSGYRTDEYYIGKATTWDAAPTQAIDALTGKYTTTHTNSTAIYDNEGGIWYANSRSKATEAEPTLVHINAEGVEDYKVDSNDKGGFYGGGGIRFNADFSLLAIGTSDKTLTVFEVSKDDNGAPVLTEKYKFATTIGRNLNDIAWDCANNLYIVSNSGELFKSVALPRESGEVVVAAPSSYDINISSDEYPASVYVIGQETGWDPENGVKLTKGENGVYTGTVTGPCNFGITTVLSADWDVVNANRYGFEVDNTAVTLNTAMPLVKAAGAIRVAEEGVFELTVDLKNMTVLVAGEAPVVYPEKLYLLGTVEPNAWDPADETHVANQISEGIYQIDNVSILAADENDYGYFAFTSTPGTWDDVNAHRYGPAVKDTELADKTMSAIGLNGDTSYKIKSGAYSITVDLGLNTIYAVRLGDNVNDAAVEAAKVVAGIGEIRIIGEANAVSIFNAAGQAVAVNSKDAQFFVASGIYVVVVDGKTTKVLVK